MAKPVTSVEFAVHVSIVTMERQELLGKILILLLLQGIFFLFYINTIGFKKRGSRLDPLDLVSRPLTSLPDTDRRNPDDAYWLDYYVQEGYVVGNQDMQEITEDYTASLPVPAPTGAAAEGQTVASIMYNSVYSQLVQTNYTTNPELIIKQFQNDAGSSVRGAVVSAVGGSPGPSPRAGKSRHLDPLGRARSQSRGQAVILQPGGGPVRLEQGRPDEEYSLRDVVGASLSRQTQIHRFSLEVNTTAINTGKVVRIYGVCAT